MGKRKHGTASVPFTFSTRNYEHLRAKRVAGENVSAYIDSAIEYYDVKINWRMRGHDMNDVAAAEFRRAMAYIRNYAASMYAHESAEVAWHYWLDQQMKAAEMWLDGEE